MHYSVVYGILCEETPIRCGNVSLWYASKDRGEIHVVQQVQDVILLLLVINFETCQ